MTHATERAVVSGRAELLAARGEVAELSLGRAPS